MAKLHRPQSGLLLVNGPKQTMILLTKDVMVVGRRQSDIILDDGKTSSSHAELRRDADGRFRLTDLHSTNGTFVNRKPIQSVVLADQDVIEIGSCTMCFFEDVRDFHGGASQDLSHAGGIREVHREETHQVEGSAITKTQTVSQTAIRFEILKGPDSGKTFSFKKSHILIGRGEGDLVLTDLDVSRHHALVEVLAPSNVYLRDLQSTNGTFINRKRASFERLQHGDTIELGNSQIQVSLGDAAV